MNLMEDLRYMLEVTFPDLTMEMDPPPRGGGDWFLDIGISNGPLLIVIWHPSRGFGLTANPRTICYGSGPEETFPDLLGVFRRVADLIEERGG